LLIFHTSYFMPFVQLNWKPNRKQLRQFGAIFLIGFLVIGLIKYFWPWEWLIRRDQKTGLILIAIGLTVGGIGLTGMRFALPFYYLWIGIAFVLGNIMSRVIMALIFYGVVTPLGLLARLIGRDKLQLKKRETESYWQDISLPSEPEKYERQF
jgi:hypothetical protein